VNYLDQKCNKKGMNFNWEHWYQCVQRYLNQWSSYRQVTSGRWSKCRWR